MHSVLGWLPKEIMQILSMFYFIFKAMGETNASLFEELSLSVVLGTCSGTVPYLCICSFAS